MKNQILCIEDDLTIQTMVTESLKDFHVTIAPSIKEAMAQLSNKQFDIILLDISLPDGDGLRFLTTFNQDSRFKKIPVLVLSGHAEISNKLMAFSVGADDFIAKPFDPLELNARVAAKIKKSAQDQDEKKNRRVGNLEIDLDRQKVLLVSSGHEQDLQLTAIELKILLLLTRRIEQVYSREQILENVWGQTSVSDRTVDSHVAHLRQKIEASNVSVDTVKNFGYRVSIKK